MIERVDGRRTVGLWLLLCTEMAGQPHAYDRPCRRNVLWKPVVIPRISTESSEDNRICASTFLKLTVRWQDKSRQCAARSGCCFSRQFLTPSQCTCLSRNVLERAITLTLFLFLHIGEASDGR